MNNEEMVPLSTMLQRRYMTDFIEELKKLGDDRERVIERAVDIVKSTLESETKPGDIPEDFNYHAYVERVLEKQLDAVFSE